MGMIAVYLMVNEQTLDNLTKLENEVLSNKFLEIEESERFDRINIDKIWDVLHCLLTGVSASNPIEGNKLSEAIIGVHNFSIKNEFMACIEQKELPQIIEAINELNFKQLADSFDWQQFQDNDIYPYGIWETPRKQLLHEMEYALKEIFAFYQKAVLMKHHIIVSII